MISIPKQNLGIFAWSSQTEAFIISSFYIGYTLSHLPAGVIADCYGAKCVLSLAIFISSLTNILMPLAIRYGEEIALVALRVIMGASQGSVYPALCALLSDWVPSEERATLGAICYSGVTMGTIFATYSSDYFVQAINWSRSLLLFGGVGFICFLVFVSILFKP